MSIMISSTLPRSSPAEFRTLSPASVLAARTRRYFLSGSAFLILFCIEMLLILLEPCTFEAYRASRAQRYGSLRWTGREDDLPGCIHHKPAPRCPGCRELSTRRVIFARWILRPSQDALSESAAPRRPVAGISVLSCVKCPLPQDRSPSLDLRFREKRLAGQPASLRRRRRSSPRQIGHFTDSRAEPLIQAPGPTAVAHNRKEHWQSLLYELWQAAGGDSWDRRIKWSCSSPVPTRHCLTACWKLGSPSSVAEDLLHYRRSCGWQWAGRHRLK